MVGHRNPKLHRAITWTVHMHFTYEESFTEMILKDRFICLVFLMLRHSQSCFIIFPLKPKDCKSSVFVFWCQNPQRMHFHSSPWNCKEHTLTSGFRSKLKLSSKPMTLWDGLWGEASNIIIYKVREKTTAWIWAKVAIRCREGFGQEMGFIEGLWVKVKGGFMVISTDEQQCYK